MITQKALQQALDGAQKLEDEGPCFCADPDCEWPHAEEDVVVIERATGAWAPLSEYQ